MPKLYPKSIVKTVSEYLLHNCAAWIEAMKVVKPDKEGCSPKSTLVYFAALFNKTSSPYFAVAYIPEEKCGI